MSEEADILSVSQFQLAPAILQGQTKAKMETMASLLQDLIGRLTSLRMQHLFMILASPRSGFPLASGCAGIGAGLLHLRSPDPRLLRGPLDLAPALHGWACPPGHLDSLGQDGGCDVCRTRRTGEPGGVLTAEEEG